MKQSAEKPKNRSWLRYVLWAMVAQTAYANRQHYHMSTTWLPHLLTNSLALLLPDAVRPLLGRRKRAHNIVEDTLMTMVRDNPHYAMTVAPLALGYIVSHPRFNIYKGRMGELRFAGLGLDAIPHAATAFAFSTLIADTFETMGQHDEYQDVLARLVQWGRGQPDLISLGALSLLTASWEYAEYRVHMQELAQRGDVTAINMQWSVDDTVRDVIANAIGWVLSAVWRSRTPGVEEMT
jgi:hypothetical protein